MDQYTITSRPGVLLSEPLFHLEDQTLAALASQRGIIGHPRSMWNPKADSPQQLNSVQFGAVLSAIVRHELEDAPCLVQCSAENYTTTLQKTYVTTQEALCLTDGCLLKDTATWQKLSLPMRLFFLLSEPGLFSYSVAWLQHGRAWKITNLDAFRRDVLHLFVGGSSSQHFRTFMRHLSLWGFRQFTKGPDSGSFFHELFLQGNPGLVKAIRPSIASQCTLHDPYNEPNLYALPPVSITQSRPGNIDLSTNRNIWSPDELLNDYHLHKTPTPPTKKIGGTCTAVSLHQGGARVSKKQEVPRAVAKKTKTKVPRKKWLPPLGPASTSSSSTTSKSNAETSLTWKAGAWLSSPELFSTLTTVRGPQFSHIC